MNDTPTPAEAGTTRLQKYLSERGVASRRHAAEAIKAGRVSVDGTTVYEPGLRIDPRSCLVLYDGVSVAEASPSTRTIMLNKPPGYICSQSSEQGQTVFDLLGPAGEGLRTIGRLDKESEGLLLLSNDGLLINRLTHPRYGHGKRYEVTITGSVDKHILTRLRGDMVIDGYQIRPVQVEWLRPPREGSATVLSFLLHEGRNRQIRAMCRQVNLRVLRLRRTSIGPLSLGTLSPGAWRVVDAGELPPDRPQAN